MKLCFVHESKEKRWYQMKSSEKFFKGFYLLPDGRKSNEITEKTRKVLQPKIEKMAIEGMEISGSKYAHIFVFNHFDCLEYRYKINKNGEEI